MINEIKKERILVSILAAIQFAHIVDFVVLMPLGPLFMKEMGITPIEFASLVSSYNFSAAICTLLYSFIADKFERKFFLSICFIGFIVSTFFCGLANSFNTLLIARIFAGAFGGILNSIVMALVTDLVPIVRRGKAMGVILSAFSMASIIGVPIGLAISDFYGKSATFYFIAIFSIFILIAAFKLVPTLHHEKSNTGIIEDVQNLKRIVLNKNYLKAYSFIFFMNISAFMIIPFISPYAVKNIGILQSQLKYFYLCGGFITVITSRIIGIYTDKVGAFKLFAIITVLSTIPIEVYTQAGAMTFTSFLILSAFFMSIISGRMIPAWTMISAVSLPKDRGSYMGIMNSVRSLGSAVASLIGGLIVVELPNGTIGRFDIVGHVSVILCLISIYIGAKIFNLLKKEESIENTTTT